MSSEAALRCGRTHGERGSDDAQRAMSRYGVRRNAGKGGAAAKVPKLQLEPPRVRTRNGRKGTGQSVQGAFRRGTLCGELRALFRDMRSGDYEVIPPVDLLREVFLHMDTFRQGQQQDAHEFIRLLLERLRRELCHAMKQYGGVDGEPGTAARKPGLPASSPPDSALATANGKWAHGWDQGGGDPAGAQADVATAAGTKRRLIVGGGSPPSRTQNGEQSTSKRIREDGVREEAADGDGDEDCDEKGYMIVSRWGYVKHKPHCQCRPCTSRRAREKRGAHEHGRRGVEDSRSKAGGDAGPSSTAAAPCAVAEETRKPLAIDLIREEYPRPPAPKASGDVRGTITVDTRNEARPPTRFMHSPTLSEASPPSIPVDPISRVFGGALINRVLCHGCRHTSIRYETFLDLSLCIPEAEQGNPASGRAKRKAAGDLVKINELLEHFTRTELLNTRSSSCTVGDGDGMYFRCARCGSASAAAEKRVEICALPEVLCLHLKRFAWVPTTSATAVGGKIDRHVEFPTSGLDMAPYMMGGQVGPELNGNGATAPDAVTPRRAAGANAAAGDMRTKYDLAAVIAHTGKSMDSGHYLAMVFHPESGAWLEFNDAKVQVVQESYVKQQSAYILFYKRRDVRSS